MHIFLHMLLYTFGLGFFGETYFFSPSFFFFCLSIILNNSMFPTLRQFGESSQKEMFFQVWLWKKKKTWPACASSNTQFVWSIQKQTHEAWSKIRCGCSRTRFCSPWLSVWSLRAVTIRWCSQIDPGPSSNRLSSDMWNCEDLRCLTSFKERSSYLYIVCITVK